MTDLKNYDKAIRVHSQEELEECERLFREAGIMVNSLLRYSDDSSDGWIYFAEAEYDRRWSLDNRHYGREIIQYKDFRKELDMGYKEGDLLVEDDGYRKILKVLGSDLYVISQLARGEEIEAFDRSGGVRTKNDLDEMECSPLGCDPYAVKEMTIEEVSELVGEPVKIVEKK